MDRFSRQYILPGFGEEAQRKLRNSKVLVVGAGGLGCPALLYLAAAGVGQIGIVDGDLISLSNLNRQVLFGQQDIGKNKAERAAQILREKYPDLKLEEFPYFLNTQNCLEIIQDYDLIVDGTDNFPTRYMVNDASVLLGKPLVLGAIYQNEGQVTLLNGNGRESIHYRDIYPTPPSLHEIPNCNETGVMGVLPGIIGTMQAAETIKFLSGFGETLTDQMLIYNWVRQKSFTISLSKNPNSEALRPKTKEEFEKYDYNMACGAKDSISWKEALNELNSKEKAILLDVRGTEEMPKFQHPNQINIPLDHIEPLTEELLINDNIYIYCQSGIRSLKAAKKLLELMPGKNIYSISGGILAEGSPIYVMTHGKENS